VLTCDIELNDYRALVGRSLDVIERHMDQSVEHAAVEGEATAKAAGRYQDRTGRLRGGIVARFVKSSGREVVWELLSPMPYSAFVENPTRAHTIRARNGGYLAFRGAGGDMVFRREVQHPGTPGFPFMGPGYQQAERTLVRELEKLPVVLARVWQ
jgi:hypothetical protein